MPDLPDDATLPAAVLFDMDGTLTVPLIDFDAIRRDLGQPAGPILEWMATLSPADRSAADTILLRHEDDAAERSTLNPGCRELLDWLDAVGVGVALVTRNTRRSVDVVRRRHDLHIDVRVTREDGKFKPDPAPLLLACDRLGVTPDRAWMVGDGYHDVEAGLAAAMAATVWVAHGIRPRPFAAEPTLVCDTLPQLHEHLRVLHSRRER